MSGKGKGVARMIVMVCMASLTALAGIALADGGGGGGGQHCDKHRQPGFSRMAEKLGLTDAQKARAKEIFQGNREAMKPMIQSLRAEQRSLRALMQADTIDEAAIRSQTARVSGIRADLNVERAKMGAQFRAILTPAQLATLKDLKQKHQKKGERFMAPY